MKTYNTLITVAGLRRADASRAREPIGEGEVIELPGGYARSLLASGAIEPSNAEVTVELDWDQPVQLIKSNDPEGLKKALEVYGMDFAKGLDLTAVQIGTVGIAPTDVQALAQALEAAGATVALQGEEWPVHLQKVDQPLLLAEVARRVGSGEIVAEQLPEELLGVAWELLAKGVASATDTSGETKAAAEQAAPPPPPVEQAPEKPAKPARKRT